MRSLSTLVMNDGLEDGPVVAWLNPLFGKLEHQGAAFEDWKIYREYRERYVGLVMVPEVAKLEENAVSCMLKERLTFDEAIGDSKRLLMVREWLYRARERLFQAMEASQLDTLGQEALGMEPLQEPWQESAGGPHSMDDDE